ncbi:MAG: TonB-dependent receptor [Bacteroidales bacterium]
MPNGDLAPEYSYNGEISIRRTLQDHTSVEAQVYYTRLRDAIVRSFFTLKGADSLLYDGDIYRITANTNAGKAHIYGAAFGLKSRIFSHLELKSTLNLTRGWNLSEDVPLGHIPPVFGRSSLEYRKNDWFNLILYARYAGWKLREDFSPYGEDNDEEAMLYGWPSWWTANLSAGFRLSEEMQMDVSLENIFDVFYKPYASGVSAPGRNFNLTLRYRR